MTKQQHLEYLVTWVKSALEQSEGQLDGDALQTVLAAQAEIAEIAGEAVHTLQLVTNTISDQAKAAAYKLMDKHQIPFYIAEYMVTNNCDVETAYAETLTDDSEEF